MAERPHTSRRRFLKLATATTVAASSRLHLLHAQDPPPRGSAPRVGVATIGLGIQGFGDTRAALKAPGVELVAVADLYDGRLTLAKEAFGDKVAVTRDYKEVLARPDVDAVIVATPDHWHMPIAVEALAAGKHVYCEKPMVQFWEEGHKVIDAQKRSGKVVQVGSQRASAISSLKARDLLASGAIGELNMVDAWLSRNSAQGAWQYFIPPDASPVHGGLGPFPRPRSQAALRSRPLLPLAQLPGLRHRRGRRPVRPPLHRPARHHGVARAHAGRDARAACASGTTAATCPT